MGNAVVCNEPKKRPQQKQTKTIQQEPPAPKLKQPKTTPPPIVVSYNCLIHTQEPIRAVCLAEECTEQRTLCCECLIDSACPKKIRISEFAARLRTHLSKDAQDVFMELFDEKNNVKQDLTNQVAAINETVHHKLLSVAEKHLQQLVVNYYLASHNFPMKVNKLVVSQLQLIIEGRASEACQESLDFALYLLGNRTFVETLCEDIEKKKNQIGDFVASFTNKFVALQNKYLEALKFLFHLLITPMEYLVEEEVKPQQKKVNKLDKKVSKVEEVVKKTSERCLAHQGEVLAVCIKLECDHKERKMCAECLIDTKCGERMKIMDFSGRVSRLLSKDVIEQLCVPWEDNNVVAQLSRLFKEAVDNTKNTFIEQQQTIVKDMYIKYHLLDEATPKELRGAFNRDFFDQFMNMVQNGKVASTNPSVLLGIRILNNHQLVDTLLGAIVKTEQILPKKADKLQHKLVGVTQYYLDKVQHLMDIYKQHSQADIIDKQFSLMNVEAFSLEETIYKIKNDGKSVGDWEPSYSFKCEKNVIDVCFFNENTICVALLDGSILVFNVDTKKHVTTLRQGTFVTSVRAFTFNGMPVLVSSGFSNQGHSLSVWDLRTNKPVCVIPNAHSNSIRKVKYLHVNPSLAQTFYSSNSTAAQLSSQLSGGSQLSIYMDIDEHVITCSDDGCVKLWRMDKQLKLIEDQTLKTGQQVLDFTMLNGCILVTAHPDKSLQISLPFQSQHPFQNISDDSPVYAISPIDQLQSKKKATIQQKFITGNERGVAKIYHWQNGRAVIMKILTLHEDKINKISMMQPGFVASVSNDKDIALTLIQQAKVLTRLSKHEFPVISFAYLRTSGFFVTADQSGTIIIWK